MSVDTDVDSSFNGSVKVDLGLCDIRRDDGEGDVPSECYASGHAATEKCHLESSQLGQKMIP